MVSFRDNNFTATQNGIYVWKRARPLRCLQWTSPDDEGCLPGPVVTLLILGDILLSLHADGCIRMWDHRAAVTGDLDQTVLLQEVKLPEGLAPTCMLHPETYVNKVVVGTQCGSLLIVNVRSGKVLYQTKVTKDDASITCLASSPAVDVIGIGFSNGIAAIHNIRLDERIVDFSTNTTRTGVGSNSLESGVTSLSFSFGNTLRIPTLAATSEAGHITLWNLKDRVLLSSLPLAHEGGILFASFLRGQPLLLTAGSDNAIKVWLIDKLDGALKLLRSRTGHVLPPRLIRYFASSSSVASLASGANAEVCEIASAGSDRALRLFHTALDRQNCELSQGPLTKRARELNVSVSSLKLPPVVALSTADRRAGHWSDLLTAHSGSSHVACWSWRNRRLDPRVLAMPDPKESATAVHLSSCGNFAVCGGSGGTVCLFNVESGARRGVFPDDPSVRTAMTAKGKKRGARYAEDLGPTDRDTGRADEMKKIRGNTGLAADSVDVALALGAGVTPPPRQEGQYVAPATRVAYEGIRTSDGMVFDAHNDYVGGDTYMEEVTPNTRHQCAISGVMIDAVNEYVISTDVSGLLIWFDFKTRKPVAALRLPSPATSLQYHKDSGLIVLLCDDFALRVVDIAMRRVIRTFTGHTNRVTDVAFSPDGRWLCSASVDRTVRVFDVPTGRCVDWMAFAQPVVSLTFAPTGEYLVTAHADSVALYLWANKAHFGSVMVDVAPPNPVFMDLPQSRNTEEEEHELALEKADQDLKKAAAGEKGSDAGANGLDSDAESEAYETAIGKKRLRSDGTEAPTLTGSSELDTATDVIEVSPYVAKEGIPPLPGCNFTLSGLPQAFWINMSKLDLIAERNKPKEAPKKPESVPFFLATSGGLNPVFVAPTQTSESAFHGSSSPEEGADAPKSRLLRTKEARMARSRLAYLLRDVQAALASEANNKSSNGDCEESPQTPNEDEGTANPSTKRSRRANLPLDEAFLAVSDHLASLSATVVDAEIRSLCIGPEDNDGVQLLVTLLKYLIREHARRRRFDLTQAHTNLILKVYQDIFGYETVLHSEMPALLDTLARIQKYQARKLQAILDRGLCMISTFLGQ